MNAGHVARNDTIMRIFPSIALISASLSIGCAVHAPTRSGSPLAGEQTPTERYEAYRSTLDHARTLDEVLPLTSDAVRDEMAKRPRSLQRALLADMQMRKIEWMRVTSEEISGDTATLNVEGVQVVDPMRGARGFGHAKVVLLREKGAWRVDDETWTLEGEDTSGITPRDWAATEPKAFAQ